MKQIAISIMVVGLCFYNVYHYKVMRNIDSVAVLISLIGAIWLLLS